MNAADFRAEYGPAALVTGASAGIGRAFAEELAAMGFDLVVVARRVERLNELAARLGGAYSVKVSVVQVDLTQTGATDEMLAATAALDVGLVVSNAGFGLKGAHESNDAQAMTDMLMVNCNVPLQLARGFIPRLRKRGGGGIIFTSSVEGLIGCPFSGAYSASKALVNALGEALWAELTSHNIKVLTLCPGATESEAAGLQGIDISKLQNVMKASDVARLALENIGNGPTYIPSDHYRASFTHLTSMPRRDALTMMARAMKP